MGERVDHALASLRHRTGSRDGACAAGTGCTVPVVHRPSRTARRVLCATLRGQLPQALAIVAPMLAVPIGRLLTGWMVPIIG